MPFFSRRALAVAAFATSVSAFDPSSKTNVVTYWGQGAYQQRLLATCQNPSIDIINLGFVDIFPDQGPGGYPGTNFGNACWGDVYNNDGTNTTLLKTCPDIGPDIQACQETYGKKIFLSLGGGTPNQYYIDDDASGESFADFLWGAFGPASANTGQPRPFGDSCVDGFDFDIESSISPPPQDKEGNTIDYETSGYAAMINHLKNDLYPQDQSKSYYISGSPQCALPDVHFTSVMQVAWFDFLWIQFYNTPQCSARAGIQFMDGQGSNDISYGNWEKAVSLNQDVKMYVGLAASETASNDPSFYLTPAEAQQLLHRFSTDGPFGGVMLWEATYDQNNTICGNPYSTWIKDILTEGPSFNAAPSTCSTPSTTTSSVVSTPTPTVLTVSPDGSCGGNTSYTCEGSSYGQCCSIFGFCGGSDTYCGTNCNAQAGLCGSAGLSSTSSPILTSTMSSSSTVSTPSTPVISTTATTTSTPVISSSTVSTTSTPVISSSVSGKSYTTFTSLCSETINGTVVPVTHTHSAVITASSSSTMSTTWAEASTSMSHTSSTAHSASTSSTTHPASQTVGPSSPSDFTTFTTLCSSTINGTVVPVTHTHSAPISTGSASSGIDTSSSFSWALPTTDSQSSASISWATQSANSTLSGSASSATQSAESWSTVWTTDYMTTYTTICPVTAAYTSERSTVTSTYLTVSTVISHIHSTVTIGASSHGAWSAPLSTATSHPASASFHSSSATTASQSAPAGPVHSSHTWTAQESSPAASTVWAHQPSSAVSAVGSSASASAEDTSVWHAQPTAPSSGSSSWSASADEATTPVATTAPTEPAAASSLVATSPLSAASAATWTSSPTANAAQATWSASAPTDSPATSTSTQTLLETLTLIPVSASSAAAAASAAPTAPFPVGPASGSNGTVPATGTAASASWAATGSAFPSGGAFTGAAGATAWNAGLLGVVCGLAGMMML